MWIGVKTWLGLKYTLIFFSSQYREKEKELLVYNCISSADNPLTFGKSVILVSRAYLLSFLLWHVLNYR